MKDLNYLCSKLAMKILLKVAFGSEEKAEVDCQLDKEELQIYKEHHNENRQIALSDFYYNLQKEVNLINPRWWEKMVDIVSGVVSEDELKLDIRVRQGDFA